MSSRKIKQEILALLASADLDHIFREIEQYAEKDLISPLFSALSRPEEMVRWHAISVFGQVVPRLADQDMEAARIVMRRFLWSLNDESGGIGWGAPEAMAEIMLHHDQLTDEYLHMLLSYLKPDGPLEHQDGNFLELPSLQCGLLWGIGRLAERRTAMLISPGVVADLLPYLQSEDGAVRGLAVWSLGRLRAVIGRDTLLPLATDSSQVRLYQQGHIQVFSVADLVENALLQITPPCDS
jgi:HEAT repeat protein